jgi:hypothetical protein
MGAGEGGWTAVKPDLVVTHARSAQRRACGVALVLALSACAIDDGATGLPSSLLESADIVISAVDPDTATIDTTVTVRITGLASPGIHCDLAHRHDGGDSNSHRLHHLKSPTEIEALIVISPDAGCCTASGSAARRGSRNCGRKFRVVAKPTALPEPGTKSGHDINDSGGSSDPRRHGRLRRI